MRIGLNSSLTGYHYICKAIELLIENPGDYRFIKTLYDKILVSYSGNNNISRSKNVRPATIERNIRFCIETVWYNHMAQENHVLSLLFKGCTKKPRISTFLCAISDYVLLLKSDK